MNSKQQIIAVVVSILFQWLSILCIDTVFLGSPEYCEMYRNTFVSILIVSSLGLRGSSKGSPWFDRKWGRRTFRGRSRCFHRAWWKHWQQTILDSFAILEFGMPAHDWAKCQKNIHQLPGNRTVSELFSSQAMIAERSKQASDLDIIGLTIKCIGGRWQLWWTTIIQNPLSNEPLDREIAYKTFPGTHWWQVVPGTSMFCII